jgi:CRP/FNR family transcriptional regulator
MSRDRYRELLRGTPYFAGLDDAALDDVVAIAIARRYGPGERIFTEDRDAGIASLHIVESGSVRVFKISSEGREQILRLMRPGDAFSDVPAFDGGAYPASADAQEPSTMLAIPRQALLDMMEAHPTIAIGALHNVAERLRHMTSLVEDLSLRRVMSRVARLLLEDEDAARLTQSQIAAMVGTAREMVNRSLHTLEDRGLIVTKGSRIEIVDAEGLAAIVEKG